MARDVVSGFSRPPGSPVCCPIPTAPNYYTGGYADVSGVEGADSCLALYSRGQPGFDVASAACSSNFTQGSHLLTTLQTRAAADGSDLLSTALTVSQTVIPSCNAQIVIGARVPTASTTATTWTWVDGTNASNLDCGAQGCNLWFPGNPRYASAFRMPVLGPVSGPVVTSVTVAA